ncbi:MAG: RNA signal recognition particle [Crocinitomicaceae bacterium]|nr:RNA signal recognition particle [Crocinitomicaceae bacterium]
MKQRNKYLNPKDKSMENYIDGFVLPVPRIYLNQYKKVAEKVAEIWKEYGAIAYFEFVGDDLTLEGTKSFTETIDAKEEEEVVFGWVVFPSKEIRDLANQKVPMDPRMTELVTPLIKPEKLIFDASRMVYGGFKPLVQSNE